MKARRLGLTAALLVAMGWVGVSAYGRAFPKPLSSILPMYPEVARSAHVAGSVKLWFTVNEKGEVAGVGAISGNSLLRDAAIAVVASWRFQPDAIRANAKQETEFVYNIEEQSSAGDPKLTVSMADFRRVEITTELYIEPIE